MNEILIDKYDYALPQERIALHPLAERDRCKLLELRPGNEPKEHIFNELPDLLPENAALIYNNTRVINARMRLHKPTGAAIEIFCLEPAEPADYEQNFASTESCTWSCLVGNAKRWKEGALTTELTMPDGNTSTLEARCIGSDGNARLINFAWTGGYPFAQIIDAAGVIPIPPYLNRDTEESDSDDYQTVYSHIDGSVAAPTAGLHFTDSLLQHISEKGIERLEVTLHVGAGTFQPVKSDDIAGHTMHSEFIAVNSKVIDRIAEILNSGRPIIAVGTTSVRTLESIYQIGCLISQGKWAGEVPQWYPYSEDHPGLTAAESIKTVAAYLRSHNLPALLADTRIIIVPGYSYRVVSGMVTNFHQPRSTLLLLVSAFIGDDRWRPLYDYAIANDFRFLSYGDACLLFRHDS